MPDLRHAGSRPIVDFASAAQAALLDLRDRVGLDGWLVARRDGDDYVVLAAADDVFGTQAGAVTPWEDSLCARMADGTAPMVAPDVDLVPAYAHARESSGVDAKSFLSVPISAPDGVFLGALCGAGTEARDDTMVDLIPTVQLQAAMLGTLLSHELRIAQDLRTAERLGDTTQVDPATGAANRRAWDAALAKEERRARLHASSVAVVVLDLDMLRLVNQAGGHSSGDELLVRTASLLRAQLRGSDLVARLGGGTFGLLLPLTDLAGTRVLADHLASVLAANQVDASIGIGVRHNSTGLAAAWADADVAMHLDKLSRAARRLADSAPPPTPVDAPLDTPLTPLESPTVTGATATPITAPAAATRGRAVRAAQAGSPAPPLAAPGRITTTSVGTTSVDALLRLARDQLGMDVAFLSVFEGENRRIRNTQSNVELPVPVGFTEPSDRTYCRLIADGRVGQVSPDAATVPLLAALPVTAALGIRAYVGVPIHRRNGELYGTLCAFSLAPDPTLQARDAGVLRSLGEIAMDLVEVEDKSDGVRHDLIARLDALYGAGGPHPIYQPVVTLDRLDVVGYEALSRFPVGSPSPTEWFRATSAAGLGTDLELRALANAVRALPHIPGYLAVNVSPATVRTPGFARQLAALPLERLVLELTEHEQIHDYASVTESLRPLRAEGLRIAVDDAGAGFASMAHILALVPDLIKLDISLVRHIDVDVPRQAMAAALTAFAVTTGAGVIAEGVETAAELECLRSLGIGYGQGYHLGRPAPLPVAGGPSSVEAAEHSG